MSNQNFSNHTRMHPLFHYFIIPVSVLIVATNVYLLFTGVSVSAFSSLITSLLLLMIALLARDYAKKNQDRIIRTELRLRYFQLVGKDFQTVEDKITKDQLVALRFADNTQFIELTSRPDLPSLSSLEIKKQLKTWNPDLMRV